MLKTFFYIILLLTLYSTCLSAQASKKVKIKLDNKNLEGNFKLWFYVKVQHTDTSFFHQLNQKNEVLNLTKKGKYTFTFYSIFGDQYIKQIELTDKNNYTLSVSGLNKYFKKQAKTTLFSEQVKPGDTLFVLYFKNGPDMQYEKLGITCLPDKRYKAMLFKGFTEEVFMDYTVKESEFSIVTIAEKAVKQQTGDCKTDFYCFGLRKKFYIISDPSCDYPVIDKIKMRLFIVEGR
jgi:hypothetical protein